MLYLGTLLASKNLNIDFGVRALGRPLKELFGALGVCSWRIQKDRSNIDSTAQGDLTPTILRLASVTKLLYKTRQRGRIERQLPLRPVRHIP